MILLLDVSHVPSLPRGVPLAQYLSRSGAAGAEETIHDPCCQDAGGRVGDCVVVPVEKVVIDYVLLRLATTHGQGVLRAIRHTCLNTLSEVSVHGLMSPVEA